LVSLAGPSFSIGSVRCSLLLDGDALYEPEEVFANAPREVWDPLLADRLDPEGYLPLPYQPVLVRTDGATVLIDGGAGPELAAEWGEPVGQTRASLEELRTNPDDVEAVLITHAHPDHVGGLTEKTGDERVPVFRRARHVMASDEWHFWHSDDLPESSSDMAPIARTHLASLADAGILELVDGEVEIAAGVRAFPTPGHTPGHMSASVSSEGQAGIVAGDAILTEWSFEHPDWCASSEVDSNLTVTSRKALLARAVAEDALLTAYHVRPIGRVRRVEQGFAFDQQG
jgi:glyoxylase-like metal-dependent hydrolase (beta-lactamase superfamily II)